MQELAENIYTILIPLPGNPLRSLNCYVIRGERNLLIDTGFNQPECTEALLNGMNELGLTPENTDIFLTHLHSDHTGNAGLLYQSGYRILIGRTDGNAMKSLYRLVNRERMLQEGMPPNVLEKVFAGNPGAKYAPGYFEPQLVDGGDILEYGGFRLECLEMPGHTPGHICLYDREKKLIFLGDHVLFDITPNITVWHFVQDSLGDYLNSLRTIRELPIEKAFPAHRSLGTVTVRERVDALLRHHQVRLDECESVVRTHANSSAYEIAGRMTWKIRCTSWEEFPAGQKYFAVGETLAHLDHLVQGGRILRSTEPDGTVLYRAAD